MSVEFDSRTTHADSHSDPDAVVCTLPDRLRVASSARTSLTLPEAAGMLEEGLCRLVARSPSDDDFWRAFSSLYENLASDLADPQRTRLAFHADYALARMGLPMWTVVQQSLQQATVKTSGSGRSESVAAAA